MALVNEHFLKLPGSYLFSDIAKKVNTFKVTHPKQDIIRLGIGDVTRPLPQASIEAMHKAVEELTSKGTFRGYGPEQGYDFLIDAIIKNDFTPRGIHLSPTEVFVNDGAKSDTGNIGDILRHDNSVGVTDPIYPAYIDSNVSCGRAGVLEKDGKWSNVVYLKCTEETGFIPELPTEKVDVIYLCNPNNPTGTTMNKTMLKQWVDYAIEHESIIIYDAAYQSYVVEPDVPRSIYEIKGARKVAIEIRSYSKTAGFTGLRCGFSIFPQELMVYSQMGEKVPFIKLWSRRNANYTNGVSYIVQRGAEAIYSRKGKNEVKDLVNYYLSNAGIIRNELLNAGLEVYGGISSPYVWFKTPDNQPSWKFFQQLLYEFQIVGTPGVVFGQSGEGFMRFTGFSSREGTLLAMERLRGKL